MIGRVFAVAGVVIKELYRRKDVYVLFVLTALLTLLAGSATFFDDDRIVRYVKEISLLLIWVSALVIAVTMSARHLPMERENRTIFPLLAKPIRRRDVLLGKFAGCWAACCLALLVFYAFFAVVTFARDPSQWHVVGYLQAMVLHMCMLAIVVAMGLAGSLAFAAPSSTTTILLVVCTGILLVGRHLSKVALTQPEPVQTVLYVLYYTIPHLEFFDVRDLIVHDWPRIAWPVVAMAVGYAAAYSAFFLGLGMVLFRRKSLT